MSETKMQTSSKGAPEEEVGVAYKYAQSAKGNRR